MESFTADQLVGHRFKLQEDVTVYTDRPGGGPVTTWAQGRITPPVDSWFVSDQGKLYWMFGEFPPLKLIEQDPDSLEPYEGNQAPPLNMNDGKGVGLEVGFNNFSESIADFGTGINTVLKVIPWIIGGFVTYKLIQTFR